MRCKSDWTDYVSIIIIFILYNYYGFPGGSVVKNPPANTGEAGSISGQENPLVKELATHSSILVWEIPWTEEPGGLWFAGLLKFGHNLPTKQQQ